MTGDEMREQITDVLMDQDWWNCDANAFADALLPVVQRIADQRAAQALREARAEAREPFRKIIEEHAWGEEDPLAVRDQLWRALRSPE